MGFSQKKKHTGLGMSSLILSIIALVLVILIFVFIFVSFGFMTMFLAMIFALVGFILSLIALIFGAIAFFGRHKDKFGLIGFILGVVLLVMSIISPSIASYIAFTSMIEEIEPVYEFPPNISVIIEDHSDNVNGAGDNLFTIRHVAGDSIYWDYISVLIYNDNATITYETNAYYLSGSFSVGDIVVISENSYDDPVSSETTLTVRIIHELTDTLLSDSDIEIE